MLRGTSGEGNGMDRITHEGGCHCANLRWRFDTTRTSGEFAPRACDCEFCSRHRAAWVSDSQGALRIEVQHGADLQRYRQGSKQAEFLVCRVCGVLVAVVARSEDGRLLGAVNRNAFDRHDGFADETTVSPRLLPADAKLDRWTHLWTPTDLAGNG
jgi:hypothetical protein